jgi:hypothetical protein
LPHNVSPAAEKCDLPPSPRYHKKPRSLSRTRRSTSDPGPHPGRFGARLAPAGAEAAKVLSHLGRWDKSFSRPTFFEVGGIGNYFPIPLLSRQVG